MELMREQWTRQDYQDFVCHLRSLGEQDYKDFNDRIIPDAPNALGIRIPVLRKIAKEIAKGNARAFIACEKGNCHEEILIEGLVLTLLKIPYPQLLSDMKYFCKSICNWAVCDTVSFKQLKNYLPEFQKDADFFLFHENPWFQRFGFGCLLQFYLTEEYIGWVLEKVNAVNSEFYYVQMMQAWLLATAAAKCEKQTLSYLEHADINDITMNMTIRKMRESYRISKDIKEEILRLKRG